MSNPETQAARRKQQQQDNEGVEGSFPYILHKMLDEVDAQGLAHVVSWQPHGRCFVVHKRRSFVDSVLPVYFRTSKFASFQRQLNLYGFHRITSGQDRNGYYHELFVRGRRDLCKLIIRVQVKGTGPRKPDAPEMEPNFYQMEFMPPTATSEEQKMPPSWQDSTLGTTAATSLSGMMMESAARARLLLAATDLAATPTSLFASTSSSLPPLAARSELYDFNTALQPPQTLALAASTNQWSVDPTIAALRGVSLPYNLQTSNLTPFAPSSIFHQHPTELITAPSNLSIHPLSLYSTTHFDSMSNVGPALGRTSLLDVLQRDSANASLLQLTGSQHLLAGREDNQEQFHTFQQRYREEHHSDDIHRNETSNLKTENASTSESDDGRPKRSSRRRRSR